MAVGKKSAKDAAMAADMKRKGVTRLITRCPMCHKIIAIVGYYAHIGKC